MTRVLSYNILVGGIHRVDQLAKIIKSKQPDIVGLIEATDEQVIQELAKSLGMQYRLSGYSKHHEHWQSAVLSRLPIQHTQIYTSDVLIKQSLLEVCVENANGNPFTVFVIHLTAAFARGKLADHARRREVKELLRLVTSKQGTLHLIMGDFNSIARGERLKGSSFLSYVADPSLYYRLKPDEAVNRPDLNFVLPPPLQIFKPLLEYIPRSKILCNLLDTTNFLYAPRSGTDLLQRAGYIDCYRHINPREAGFTWPAPMPAGRVDFIFASPELAHHLLASDVVVEGEGVRGEDASDHLAVFADFNDAQSGN